MRVGFYAFDTRKKLLNLDCMAMFGGYLFFFLGFGCRVLLMSLADVSFVFGYSFNMIINSIFKPQICVFLTRLWENISNTKLTVFSQVIINVTRSKPSKVNASFGSHCERGLY